MTKPWRCMLYPNEQVSPKDMKYPLITSYKLDGIRCIFKDGEMLSRSGKPIPNKQLHEKFALFKEASLNGVILDGELYDHSLKRNEIVSYVMSQDKEVPESLEYWVFDLPASPSGVYWFRHQAIKQLELRTPPSKRVTSPEEVEEFMQQALDDGYEGLILNSPSALYKNGRITVASGDGYKLKPYQTFDSKIIGVVQATEVDPDAEKTINELGYSETSKKKNDRIPVERAAAFKVWWPEEPDHNDNIRSGKFQVVKVTLAMTDEEREEVWCNREDYIGRTVEWKGMAHGMKDVPSHPTYIRMRPDKDE